MWPEDVEDGWELVALDDNDSLSIARISATTVVRALIRSLTEGGVSGINLQVSDMGADARMFIEGDRKGWDLFIYETSDGGIGLLDAIFQDIQKQFVEDEIDLKELSCLKRTIEILEGEKCTTEVPDKNEILHQLPRPCNSICHACLLDFSTQYMSDKLDREIGADLIRYALEGMDGVVRDNKNRTDSLLTLYRLLLRRYSEDEVSLQIFEGADVDLKGLPTDIFEEKETTYYRSITINHGGNQKEIKIKSSLVSGSNSDVISVSKTELKRNPHKVLEKIKKKLTGRQRRPRRRI